MLDPTIVRSIPLEANFLQHAILHTLAYADVFDYPLTAPEIHRYLTGVKTSIEEVSQTLNDEKFGNGPIVRMGDYFTLRGRERNVETRLRRKSASERWWKDAKFYGRILASLPFVRMVTVTGSLAMDNLEARADIDYFVVTKPGRLWTCRAMSLLIVRLAKLRSVNLCPNYFVSENALALEDYSLYTAHELAQMIPLYGKSIYNEMRRLNLWTDRYLPNAQNAPETLVDVKPARWKYVVEFVLTRLPLQQFEGWEMDRKLAKLSRGRAQNPEAFFSADVCKGHIDRHRQKIEIELERRLARLDMRYGQ
jgi:hypothetical protein